MVEKVEHIQTDLKPNSFGHIKILPHAQVQIPAGDAPKGIVAQTPWAYGFSGSRTGRHRNESGPTQILRKQRPGRVLSIGIEPRSVRALLVRSNPLPNHHGQAAASGKDAAQLPG